MPGQSTKPKSLAILLPSNKTLALYFLAACEKLQLYSPNTSIVWFASASLVPLIKLKPNINIIELNRHGISSITALRQEVQQYLTKNQITAFEQLVIAETTKWPPLLIAAIPAKQKSYFGQAGIPVKLLANQQLAISERGHISDKAYAFLHAYLPEPTCSIDLSVFHPTIDDQSQLWAAEQLSFFPQSDKPMAIVQPFASDKEHSWHGEGFAKIVDHLAEQGFNVVITGGEQLQEKLLAEQIISLSASKPLNLVSKTSISQFVALQHIAEFVISADSWPLHSAALTQTPVISLFYHRNPKIWAASSYANYVVSGYQDAVQKQYKKPLAKLPWGIAPKGKQLMRGISVAQVKDKIRQLLADLQ